jgi:hypothetical protein
MSVRKQALKYTAAALAVAAIIIVSSTLYLNQLGSINTQGGTPATLSIRLTDPPEVPAGTSSLNLTYSSIGILVAEPASGGKVTTTTVNVPGSATLDLVKLQNISKTIASASLPAGSTIYSFTFTVSSISIDVGGTKSTVTLATGGSTLTVTLAHPSTLAGDSVALLQLNPVVVLTPSGYQMIPSAVGLVRGESQGEHNGDQVGSEQQLTSGDKGDLEHQHGNITATLTALSVSGSATTITVQVKNVGTGSVNITAIGIHGNFTAQGQTCNAGGNGDQSENHESATTTTTTTSTSEIQCAMEHADEVVFIPASSSVSGTSCVPVSMNLVNGDGTENGDHALTLAAGQCVSLTFTGTISFGESHFTLVPSTASGQVYDVHVIASEGANSALSCTLPITSTSCSAIHDQHD